MGGTVAFLFAERWPDRIEKLFIEDTPPPHGSSDLSDPPDEAPEIVPFDWQLLARQLRSHDPPWWNDLSAITAPTLIIGGGYFA